MKYFLIFCLSIFSFVALAGGADTTAAPRAKAPEIPTLEAAWKPVLINHHIGIRGGYGLGSMRREPAKENVGLPFGLLNFGISYRFDVPAQKYVGTIEVDLGFMQKGFAYKFAFDEDRAYARMYNVVELPILWQPYLPLGKGGSRFYISAGPFLSYAFGGEEREYDDKTKEIYSTNKYKYDTMNDYLWGFGITAGGGFFIAIKRFAISAEFRYTIGLSDIMRGPEFVEGNPFRTPVDQMSVSLGVHYKFSIGKDPTSKQLKK